MPGIEAMSNASLQYVHRAFVGCLWSFSGIAQGVLKDQVMKHHEKHDSALLKPISEFAEIQISPHGLNIEGI